VGDHRKGFRDIVEMRRDRNLHGSMFDMFIEPPAASTPASVLGVEERTCTP
jgi:hypothetical protein